MGIIGYSRPRTNKWFKLKDKHKNNNIELIYEHRYVYQIEFHLFVDTEFEEMNQIQICIIKLRQDIFDVHCQEKNLINNSKYENSKLFFNFYLVYFYSLICFIII